MNNKFSGSYFQVLFVIFVSLGIYYPSIFGEVNSVDDYKMMQGLVDIHKINLKGLFFPESALYYYRPLLTLSFIFDKFFWGDEQLFWHVENIMIHALSGVLVFFIAKELMRVFKTNAGDHAPMFVSLLFVLHPVNTESVSWISGRTDLLAGIFVFASFFVFVRFGLRNNIYCWLASLLYLLGLMSKESAIGLLPAVILFLTLKDGYISENSTRKRISAFLPFLFITFIYAFLRTAGSGHQDVGTAMIITPKGSMDVLTKISISIETFGFYIKKLFLPLPLNFAIDKINRTFYVFVGGLMLVLTLFMLKKRNIYSFYFLFAALFFLIATPVAIYKMAWTPYAERYLYISSFGAVMFAVSGIYYFMQGRGKYVLLVPLIICAGVITAGRNIVWQNNLTLYKDTVEKSPDYSPARNEYGIALATSGRTDEALIQFAKADELSGGSYKLPSINKIVATKSSYSTLKEGRLEYIKLLDTSVGSDKVEILQRIISVIGVEAVKEKDPVVAKKLRKEQMKYILELNKISKSGYYFYRLGQLYMAEGNKKLALESFAESARLSPDDYFSDAARKSAKKLEREINH